MKVVGELRKAAEGAENVYLATDPDREGEAISAHLLEALAKKKSDRGKFYRVMFNEITQKAIRAAFEKPGAIDEHLVDAQQARRVLDRLVGYKVSPLLWDKVRRGLSAGRVQTVALRLIVEREREIRAFIPKEYWTIHALLEAGEPPAFEAKLIKHKGEDIEIPQRSGGAAHSRGTGARPSGRSPASRKKKSAASLRLRSPLRSCSRPATTACATPPSAP